jgi:hypothetical protein
VVKNPFIIIFLCICRITFSQNVNAKYIITKQLLAFDNVRASKQITAGIQDSEGFVWLSTGYGLQRYDGKNFRLFTKEKNGLQSKQFLFNRISAPRFDPGWEALPIEIILTYRFCLLISPTSLGQT